MISEVSASARELPREAGGLAARAASAAVVAAALATGLKLASQAAWGLIGFSAPAGWYTTADLSAGRAAGLADRLHAIYEQAAGWPAFGLSATVWLEETVILAAVALAAIRAVRGAWPIPTVRGAAAVGIVTACTGAAGWAAAGWAAAAGLTAAAGAASAVMLIETGPVGGGMGDLKNIIRYDRAAVLVGAAAVVTAWLLLLEAADVAVSALSYSAAAAAAGPVASLTAAGPAVIAAAVTAAAAERWR